MALTRTQAHELDDAAWRLLGALQRDARAPLKVLAVAAGLSVAATAERLKRLQDAGIAQGFTAQLDAAKAGYPVQATIGITVAQPAKKPLLDRLRAAPEVLECHVLLGAFDFLLRVVTPDLRSYEAFYFKKLTCIPGVREASTSVSISEVKMTTALPLR